MPDTPCCGEYGLIAFSVGQRTHEIGIRMALGAGSAHVLRMILWGGSKMTLIGAAIGFALAPPQSGTDIELTIPASAAYATARMSRGS